MSNNTLASKDAATTLRDLLAAQTKSIQSLLPEHLTHERLFRIAVNCVAKTPTLQRCTPTSLLQCVLVAAELGLEPGGALGYLYLVPRGNQATPIIGFRGLIELARRSGQIASIRAVVVNEKDTFKVTEGVSQSIVHERYVGNDDPGEVTFAYAIATLKDGSIQTEVMSRRQIEKVRASSASGNSGPWKEHFEEMTKKTVFRRLAKWLPLSSERFARALEIDNEDYVSGEVVKQGGQHRAPALDVRERIQAKRIENDKLDRVLAGHLPEPVQIPGESKEVPMSQEEFDEIEALNAKESK